jgi:MFS family permease
VLGSTYSALVLLFFAFPNFWGWLLLRLAIGAAIAGMHMIIESWLNERSTKETRGTLLSVYTMICLLMITVGQQLLNLAEPGSGMLFGLAAILFSLSIIPVSLTTSLAPAPINRVKISPRKLWRLSRVGTLGGIAGGLTVGAFWSLGPVYARGVGFDTFQLATFISAVVIGGAIFQLPLGRLSDHFDRRLVLLGSATLGIGTSLALGLGVLPTYTTTALVAMVWGGSVMTLYAICLAHANDRASPEDFVLVSSAMLLIHGLAAAVGSCSPRSIWVGWCR